MDPSALRDRIQTTLSPNDNARRHAEIDLRRVSDVQLLLSVCTNLSTGRRRSSTDQYPFNPARERTGQRYCFS